MKIIRTLMYVLFFAVFAVPAHASEPDRDMVSVLRQAQAGDMNAQFNLGYLYQSHGKSREDLRAAARWYEKAATRGHANAAFALGLMYEYGQGVEKNPGKAADWFASAAQIYAGRGATLAFRLARNALERVERARVQVARINQGK